MLSDGLTSHRGSVPDLQAAGRTNAPQTLETVEGYGETNIGLPRLLRKDATRECWDDFSRKRVAYCL
jgi:hypothetical protein